MDARTISPRDAFRSRRILVVDDNVDIVQTFSMMLSIIGHDVTVAYDGERAIVTALQVKPEVVFLDIGLPKLNGFQVCEALRDEFGSEVEIFAVTGYGDDASRERGRTCFDGYFTKPISALEVLERVGLAVQAS